MRGIAVSSSSATRRARIGRVRPPGEDRPEPLVDHRLHQRGLAGKIAIGGGARHAGRLGDVADRRRRAACISLRRRIEHQPAGPRARTALDLARRPAFLDVRQACQYDTRVSKKCNGRAPMRSRRQPDRSAVADSSGGERRWKRVYVVGTADTKGEELAFLADAIAATGIAVAASSTSARAGRPCTSTSRQPRSPAIIPTALRRCSAATIAAWRSPR